MSETKTPSRHSSWFGVTFLHVRIRSATGSAGTQWDVDKLLATAAPDDDALLLPMSRLQLSRHAEFAESARFLLCKTSCNLVPECQERAQFLSVGQPHAATAAADAAAADTQQGAPANVFLSQLQLKCAHWSLVQPDSSEIGFFATLADATSFAVATAVDNFCTTAMLILERGGTARVDLSHLYYIVECEPLVVSVKRNHSPLIVTAATAERKEQLNEALEALTIDVDLGCSQDSVEGASPTSVADEMLEHGYMLKMQSCPSS